ncbi:zinc ribbon domain-containing protein [Luteolibacter flavescens]|uniref:Zinc ribbon domain-containing protein n=1 Tax=Luteolibacter flavescens TaxID=1859460 RepID=A0ABT3FU06_9BACT|nr:TFIIB-type zinc ribbon-containing protein [Luteolibacter flavescens]MCW1887068.1 zinc ribbon domain-containing protein [Luteolibacter flavescens]
MEPTDSTELPDEQAPPLELPKKRIPPPLPGQRGVAAEVRSLERHVCPECGGKAEWDPGKKELVCPYCGTHFPNVGPPPMPGSVVEHDLDATLATLGDKAANVDTATRRVECNNCHAVLVRGAGTVAQHCDFCGSPELLDYQDIQSPILPESLLPAAISKEQAYHAIKAFLAARWFAPNDLKRRNLIDRIHRVYLPYWTFDSSAECPWTAESGTYYYVTVQSRDSNGRTVSRRERRTKWRPARGHVSTWFDDVVVSGSRGLDTDLLRKLEPFPTKDLVPYETRYVSGWQVEHYQVPLLDAARLGFGTMEGMLREMCGREVPGDTYRNLRIFPQFSDKTFKHILVPIWLLAYQYRGKTWQGAVNAVTGTAHARFPLSAWKIAFVTLLVIAVIALVAFIANSR